MAAFGSGYALDRQGRCLGLGGRRFQRFGRAFGGIMQVQVQMRSSGKTILSGQGGIGVLGSQPGHGNGALDQALPGSV